MTFAIGALVRGWRRVLTRGHPQGALGSQARERNAHCLSQVRLRRSDLERIKFLQREVKNHGQPVPTIQIKKGETNMPNYINQICRKSKNLLENEKGQGLVEYALILVLIAVVVIAALTTIGNRTNTVMSTVGSSLVTK